MHKKFPVILVLATLSLLPKSYSQQAAPPAGRSPSRSATPDPNDYTPLPAGQIIEKLQEKIISWQDYVINGLQAQIIMPNLYKEMASISINTDTGEVKDQKLLDLLSKYGIEVSTKDGKQINTPSKTPPIPVTTQEALPLVGNSVVATDEEKKRIGALMAKGRSLLDRANGYKKLTASLQALILELLDLAKTDKGTQALVDKYHIKQRAPIPTPTPSPNMTP